MVGKLDRQPQPVQYGIALAQDTTISDEQLLQEIYANELRNMIPLPESSLIPTAEAFLDGELISWGSARGPHDVAREALNPTSTPFRFLATLARNPSEAGERAVAQLATHYDALPTDAHGIFSNGEEQAWFLKLIMVQGVLEQIEDPQEDYHNNSDSLVKIIAGKSDQFLASLARLSPDDYAGVIRLQEVIVRIIDEQNAVIAKHKKQAIRVVNQIPAGKTMLERTLRVTMGEDDFTDRFMKDLATAQGNISQGWDLHTTYTAVDALAHTTTDHLREDIIAAIDANVAKRTNGMVFGGDTLPLPGPAYADLLRFTWADDAAAYVEEVHDSMPELTSLFDENVAHGSIEFPTGSVPAPDVPSAAISLLLRTLEGTAPEKRKELLELFHARFGPQNKDAWCVALLAVQTAFPDLTEDIQERVENWKKLAPAISSILSEREAGTVFLVGKQLTGVRSDRHVAHGIPLYHSQGLRRLLPTEPEKTYKEEETPPARSKIIPHEPIRVESFKALNKGLYEQAVAARDATEILRSLFSPRQVSEDEWVVLDSLLREQQSRWSRFVEPKNTDVLFHTELVPHDPFLTEAARLGIAAIAIDGSKVHFFLTPQVAHAGTENASVAVAISGSLTSRTGELQVDGAPSEFQGSPEHCLLNTIALGVGLARLKPITGLTEKQLEGFKHLPDVLRETKQAAKAWNETVRRKFPHSLSRILIEGAGPKVAVGLPRGITTVLRAEI